VIRDQRAALVALATGVRVGSGEGGNVATELAPPEHEVPAVGKKSLKERR
jgi:hypothetical protein